MKGGAFKLNMHPKTYFDGNPYASDKPLPPVKSPVKEKRDVKPFRPSHPAKSVSILNTVTLEYNFFCFCFVLFLFLIVLLCLFVASVL